MKMPHKKEKRKLWVAAYKEGAFVAVKRKEAFLINHPSASFYYIMYEIQKQ